MVGFIIVVVIALVIGFLGVILLLPDDEFGSDFGLGSISMILCGLMIVAAFSGVAVKKDEPITLPPSRYSTLNNDNIVVINIIDGVRIETFEYDDVKTYNTVLAGDFIITEVKNYNILGNYCSSTFNIELIEE